MRDSRRLSTAPRMFRLTTVKTLAGFDFAFQPSLDRNRILAPGDLTLATPARAISRRHSRPRP